MDDMTVLVAVFTLKVVAYAWLGGVILYTGTRIMSALDNLTAAVTKSTTVEASAAVAFKGIADQMKASNDPTIQKLADELNTGADALAAAIAANTPAASAGGNTGIAGSAGAQTGA